LGFANSLIFAPSVSTSCCCRPVFLEVGSESIYHTSLARGLVRKKVEVVNYPDGRFAVQFNGAVLGFKVFDKIQTVQPGLVVTCVPKVTLRKPIYFNMLRAPPD
jgi:hypothetical protein